MNKAILALVLLGFAAVAQAQFDYDINYSWDETAVTGDGEWSGYIERGVDCGSTIQTGKNPKRECNCFTDLARDRVPPTLLNNNVDRTDSVGRDRETGIVKTASVGDDADLEVAVALDFGTFYSGHPDLSGLTTSDGSAPVLRQFNGLLDTTGTTFHDSASYDVPRLVFYTKDGEGKDQEQENCRWAAGTVAGYATANLAAGANPTYSSGVSANAYADCDTGSDSTNRPILWVRKEVRSALNQCGFSTATGQDAAANGIAQPGGAVVGSSTFTIYTGTFKVIQWRQGGSLNDAEVAKKEEYPFTIQLAFPENIQVTSEVISVIGKAEYASTITHSIYESETGKEYVNVNALFGTTFPFAVSETATFNSGADVYSLKLKDDSPACAGFVSAKASNGVDPNPDTDKLNLYTARCTVDGLGVTAFTAQTQDNYRLAEPVLCDLNGNGVCDITDVFTVVEDGVLFKGKVETQDFFGLDNTGTDFSPADSALVAARCTGINYGGGATETVNGMACLQNMGMRLKPKGWCDLNANLEITINTVCRDDANGDDTKDDSLIDGTTLTEDSGVFSVINTPNTPNPFLPVSNNNVLKQSPAGDADTLECKSSQYAEQQDPKHVLTFSLRSDDFCPRVVATASVTATMAVYPSELGAATWGADLLRNAADLDAVNTIIANDDGISAAEKTDFNCVTLLTNYVGTVEDRADAFINNPLCRQVPLLSDTRVAEDAFVYGTTAYLETTLNVEAGVNVASSKIQELYVSNTAVTLDGGRTFPTAADINDADDLTTAGTRTGSPNVAENDWLKQLIASNAVVGGQQSWRTDIKSGADLVLTLAEAQQRIQFSDELITDSMLKTFVAGDPDVRNAQTYNFFAANPCANNADAPAACANQGVAYEGVSRVSVFLDDYTVYISDDAREAPENIKFWAQVAITYKAADQQGDLTSKTSSTVPSGSSDRARLMAAAAATGSQASAQGSMSVSGQAGSGGSSSTIAGFSSTTVLAVAAVLGAVVVAAGASFFVVRKRNAAAKSAKRSSSSTELNDTLAVQA